MASAVQLLSVVAPVIILTVMPALCAILIASTASSLGGSRMATISTTGRVTAAAQHTSQHLPTQWVQPHLRARRHIAPGTHACRPATAIETCSYLYQGRLVPCHQAAV